VILVAEGLIVLHVEIYQNLLEFQRVVAVDKVGHFVET